MNTEKLQKELPNKEKSLDDLVRFIETRNDNNPNYSLLLGAGCSISSGINSAQSLIEQWRKEVFFSYSENKDKDYSKEDAIEYLASKHGSWYNRNNEYSSLFEKKYNLDKQRRMFVEREVSDKKPSLGYAYLTKLVENDYFKTIFTTNFDDLINEAFYQFSDKRPIVCAHDSSIDSITVTSKRPKVIKLHGDYLFDDIKSTLRETESLEENIKKKFIEFAKDYGLIIVGYGGNDRSIMDVISYLLKHDNYYKGGIYWCVRPNSYVSEELRKLLWKDKAYYVVVDGFDEFFAEINHRLSDGELPIETKVISNKPADLIEGFIDNKYIKNSPSIILKNDLRKLENFCRKNNVVESIRNIIDVDSNSDSDITGEGFGNTELVILLSLDELVKKEKHEDVIIKAKKEISDTNDKQFKLRLWGYVFSSYEAINDYENARRVCDELIELDENNPKHYIQKSKLCIEYKERLEILNKAIEAAPFYYDTYDEKALLLINEAKNNVDYSSLVSDEIISVLDSGIEKYPCIFNPCWDTKFNFILDFEKDNTTKNKLIESIIGDLSKQDARSKKLLRMRLRFLSKKANSTKIDEIISDINEAKNKSYSKDNWLYELVYIDTCIKFSMNDELSAKIKKLDNDEKYALNVRYLNKKARVMLNSFDKLGEAISILEKSVEIDKTEQGLKRLLSYLIYNESYDKAEDLLDSNKGFLDEFSYLILKVDLKVEQGSYEDALYCIDELIKLSTWKESLESKKAYIYVKNNQFDLAEQLMIKQLEKTSYSLNDAVSIINCELAKKLDGKKVNKERLQKLYEHSGENMTKAAIAALLGHVDDVYNKLKAEFKESAISKYESKGWPVFSELMNKEKIKKLYI